MKKVLIAITLSIFLLSSCENFTFPSKVSLKTEAEYNFTVAQMEKDLDEVLPIGEIICGLNNGEGISVYDYNPGNSSIIQQLLIELDLQRIDLDILSDFTETDLSELLDVTSVKKEFNFPKINLTGNTTEIDLSSLNENINNGMSFTGTGVEINKDVDITFIIEGSSCDKVTYESGYIIISTDTCPDGTKVSISCNGIVLTSGEITSNIAECPIDEVTIPVKEEIKIRFTNETSTERFNFIGTIKEGSSIFSVENLTAEESVCNSIDFGETTIEASDVSFIESCEIQNGNLDVTFDKKNWTGVKVSEIKIECTGGLEKTLENTITDSSLNGASFNTTDSITVKVTPKISIQNATIFFTEKPSFTYDLQILSLHNAVIKTTEFDSSIEKNEEKPLSEIYNNGIRNVLWEKSGFSLVCTNNFPQGEKAFNLSVESDFFGINKTETIPFGGSKTVDCFSPEDLETSITESSSIDFSLSFDIPSEGETITLENIELGKDYFVDFNIVAEFNWKTISLDNSRFSVKTDTPIDTGINLSSMLLAFEEIIPGFASSVEFSEIPLYLFCDIPTGLFQNPSLEGELALQVGENRKYLLEKGDNLFTGTCPEVESEKITINKDGVEDSYYLVKTDLSRLSKNQTDIKDLLNGNSTNTINVDYDIAFSTGSEGTDLITLTKEAIENSSTTSIGFSAFMVLPLKMKIKEDLRLNILKMSNSSEEDSENKDILGRQPGEALLSEDLDKILGLIEEVVISYQPSQIPFSAENNMYIELDLDGDGDVYSKQILSLSGGKFPISNPRQLLEIPAPLVPTIEVLLPEGDFGIKRERKLSTNINLGISTNGKITLWEKE